jgi:hypothetical protein
MAWAKSPAHITFFLSFLLEIHHSITIHTLTWHRPTQILPMWPGCQKFSSQLKTCKNFSGWLPLPAGPENKVSQYFFEKES